MKDMTIPNGRETAARDDRPRWRPFGVFPLPSSPAGPRRRPAVLALGALALAAALALGAGEAAAQTGVCAGDPPTPGARINCSLGNIANDIIINARNVAISVTTPTTFRPAVDARTTGGTGNIIIRLGQGLEVMTSGANFQYGGYGRNRGAGDVSIVMEDGASIVTTARYGFGLNGVVDDAGSGNVLVRMTGGSIVTSGQESSGLNLQHYTTGTLTADMSGGSVRVTGAGSSGIYLYSGGSGVVTATFSGGSIDKSGGGNMDTPVAGGIVFAGGTTSTADVSIRMTGGSITTSGAGNNPGVNVDHQGTGDVSIRMTGGSIATSGDGSNHGMFVHHQGTGEADVSIRMEGGSITAAGTGISHGVFVRHEGSGGVVDVDLTGGSITTSSRDSSHGVAVFLNGTANPDGISIESGGAISTSGDGSHGMHVINAGTGNIHVAMTGGTIDAWGDGSMGINIAGHSGRTTVTVNGMVMGGTGTGAGISIVGDAEVVVGRNARIVAREQDGRAIFGGGDGELVVTIVDPDVLGDANAPRIQGRIVKDAAGSLRVRLQRPGSSESVELRAGDPPVGSGPWDVSVVRDGSGLRMVRELGPRVRLYEALPSVLLGMNGLPRFEERMAAPRTERGGWARVEASRGEWKADSSTTGVEYNHRRSDLRAGLDVPAGENGLVGVSVHHRLGSADVARGGGIKLSGSGAGVSGTWFGFGAYVDVQAEMTWYEADVRSTARGR